MDPRISKRSRQDRPGSTSATEEEDAEILSGSECSTEVEPRIRPTNLEMKRRAVTKSMASPRHNPSDPNCNEQRPRSPPPKEHNVAKDVSAALRNQNLPGLWASMASRWTLKNLCF